MEYEPCKKCGRRHSSPCWGASGQPPQGRGRPDVKGKGGKRKGSAAKRARTADGRAGKGGKGGEPMAKKPCFDFQAGKCSRDNCRFAHVKDPKKTKTKKEVPSGAPAPDDSD